MKHALKLWLREIYARLLFHTRLDRLVDRCMPTRLTILAGHCVPSAGNAYLPKDMKISTERLERIVRFLQSRYDVCAVGEGLRRLERGSPRSLVALSMDDGYRDNHAVLMPLLQSMGASATVYLVTSLLDGQRVDWSHKYFWILTKIAPAEFLERYGRATRDPENFAKIRSAVAAGGDVVYLFKKNLKYDCDPADRERSLDLVFRELGGDEARLAGELLMDWELARDMQERGFELGCHTQGHPVLARLESAQARAEIENARSALEERLGAASVETFAYPFGRRWDYKDETRALVRAAGFRAAVNTHAGTVSRESERTELARIMIDEDAKLHLIAAEACGGFDLLRRFGLQLSE